jgi:hypothetical protein
MDPNAPNRETMFRFRRCLRSLPPHVPVVIETVMIRTLCWPKLPILVLMLGVAGPDSALADVPAEVPTVGAATVPARPEVTQHDIVPVLLLRCAICHGGRKQEGNLDVRSRVALVRGGKSGPALVPGKPEESLMLKRIHGEECPPRPRLIEAMVKPMEADEIDKLTRWIALGAPEVPEEPDVAGTPADPLIRKEDREFWSFRPPQPAPIPQVIHSDRALNPLDAFMLQKLEEKGLSLAPEADRLTLLRRASFDLTGLPPEPSEAEEFLGDDSPDAYDRLIDRLLASPRYGERWGRHWLDVAGYADCEGRREQHLPRPFAWRYRDYVIRSFNADKPYDRFLLEQLAGDELADYAHATEITQEIEDNLVATAFLRMAPDPTWANLTGFVLDRLEVITRSGSASRPLLRPPMPAGKSANSKPEGNRNRASWPSGIGANLPRLTSIGAATT